MVHMLSELLAPKKVANTKDGFLKWPIFSMEKGERDWLPHVHLLVDSFTTQLLFAGIWRLHSKVKDTNSYREMSNAELKQAAQPLWRLVSWGPQQQGPNRQQRVNRNTKCGQNHICHRKQRFWHCCISSALDWLQLPSLRAYITNYMG